MHFDCLTGYSFMNDILTENKYNRYDLYYPLLFLLAVISILHCYDLYSFQTYTLFDLNKSV